MHVCAAYMQCVESRNVSSMQCVCRIMRASYQVNEFFTHTDNPPPHSPAHLYPSPLRSSKSSILSVVSLAFLSLPAGGAAHVMRLSYPILLRLLRVAGGAVHL